MGEKKKVSKSNITADSAEIIKSFESMGKISPEIARMCSPITHRYLNLALKYEEYLPDEPEKISVKVRGVLYTVTIQKGSIITERFETFIKRSFWVEFNTWMREELSELKMMMIGSAIRTSIEEDTKDSISEYKDEMKKFLKENYDLSLNKLEKELKKKKGEKKDEDI